MPLPRNELRNIQKMSTPQFRKFLKRYGRNMEEGAYRKGYKQGAEDSQAADIKITLQTALKDVKGYGPVLHERMIEHVNKLNKE